MYFRFKLDINANFTMQNGEWMFITVFSVIHSFDTQRKSFFYLITPRIFSIIRKNKTVFQPSLVPKGTISSILTIKLVKNMPAHQFEVNKDFLKTDKIRNMETEQRTH